jgi:transglutaminase-like putative cysteine protease
MESGFLASTDTIDWRTEPVRRLAEIIRDQAHEELELVRNSFGWVRDNIQHSVDFQRTEVTCRASDVLALRTGYCYAKSHLLAALLRANGVPAGFCYQRLTLNGDQPPFCLHGLNAVYLHDHGWYRIDARGNKAGVDAQFCPPREQLAFSIGSDGEFDFPEIWATPLPVVIQSLESAETVQSLGNKLPDVSFEEMQAYCESVTTKPIIRTKVA